MMQKNKFTVIRDTREKANHGWFFEANGQCNGTVIKKVNVGDYTIEGLENYICIERKRGVDEFAHNCIEKRWTECMQRMSEVKFSFILFEFSQYDIDRYPASAKVPPWIRKKMRISPKLMNKVIGIAREEYNIHVIPCYNTLYAEAVAYRIMNRAYLMWSRNNCK
jgi:ERCC4-type nuclease